MFSGSRIFADRQKCPSRFNNPRLSLNEKRASAAPSLFLKIRVASALDIFSASPSIIISRWPWVGFNVEIDDEVPFIFMFLMFSLGWLCFMLSVMFSLRLSLLR